MKASPPNLKPAGDGGRRDPGWLRSEKMLENFGVTEATWREACAEPRFRDLRVAAYVARGVAALAGADDADRWAGTIISSRQLADATVSPTPTAAGRTAGATWPPMAGNGRRRRHQRLPVRAAMLIRWLAGARDLKGWRLGEFRGRAVPRPGDPGQQQRRVVVERSADMPHSGRRAAGPAGPRPGRRPARRPARRPVPSAGRTPGPRRGLGDTVGVQQQGVTRLERHGAFRAGGAAERHQPQRQGLARARPR